MEIRWTHNLDLDFLCLAHQLDEHLALLNGDLQAAFAPHNLLDMHTQITVLYEDNMPVACGALRLHADGSAELKRMFVVPTYRRKGLARQLLCVLESRAQLLACHMLVLETNPLLIGAVALYRSFGFVPIDAFGPYRDLPSLCMGKLIAQS